MVSQGAHASMKIFFDLMKSDSGGICSNKDGSKTYSFTSDSEAISEFIIGKFPKITCSVDSLEELLEIERQAKEAGLLTALITDAGYTEFHGVPTITALAIGPNWNEDIDKITKNLKLL